MTKRKGSSFLAKGYFPEWGHQISECFKKKVKRFRRNPCILGGFPLVSRPSKNYIKKTRKDKHMGYYLLAILAVFFWSFNVIVASYLKETLLPWQIAYFRWFIAAVCLLPFTLPRILKQRRILLKHTWFILALSAIGIAFSNTCAYYAATTVSAIDMSLISITGPVFLLLFAHVFSGVRLHQFQRIGLGLILMGLFLVLFHGRLNTLKSFHFAWGDLWMFGLASSFGLYSYLMTRKPRSLGQTTLLAVTVSIGCLLTVPLFMYENTLNPLTHENMTKTVILIMLYMGVFNSVLAYLFWNVALNKLGSLRAGSLYYLMPVFSTITAHYILGERVFVSQLIGGAVILSGIWLTNTGRRSRLKIERP